jgi:putative Ca2+/H+ antiporter (TMEM165/GDT1 family)
MDFQLLGLSFIAVFLSELGDKSQVAAIALSGTSKSPRAIFFGTAFALLLASFIGVILGQGMAEVLPTSIVKIAAAVGFAIMGIRLVFFPSEVEEEEI